MAVLSEHIVDKDHSGTMLMDYVLQVFDEFPTRSSIKKAIKRGELQVDGNPERSGYRLAADQLVSLMESEVRQPKPNKLLLEVIYEDEYLAVINKPAGFEVSGNSFNTIQNAIPANIQGSSQSDALKIPRPVHRLDYPTSGLLLIAKTRYALSHLGNQFENRIVKKRYRALVAGRIEQEGKIDTEIDGQSALTEYKPVSYLRSLKTHWITEVDLFPLTGRKHQLRIHMAILGNPIVGEKKYGEGPVLKGKGLFLSAVEINFLHPDTEEQTRFEISPPAKFTSFTKRQQQNWEKYHNNP